jgi:hypothetical protein
MNISPLENATHRRKNIGLDKAAISTADLSRTPCDINAMISSVVINPIDVENRSKT